MTETEELSVLVYSKRWWEGPIKVRMSRTAFNDPEGLGRTIAVPQVMDQLPEPRPTCDELGKDAIEFRLESDVIGEGEATAPSEDTIPITKPAPDPSQQKIPYTEPESAREKMGYPPKGEAEEWRRSYPKS